MPDKIELEKRVHTLERQIRRMKITGLVVILITIGLLIQAQKRPETPKLGTLFCEHLKADTLTVGMGGVTTLGNMAILGSQVSLMNSEGMVILTGNKIQMFGAPPAHANLTDLATWLSKTSALVGIGNFGNSGRIELYNDQHNNVVSLGVNSDNGDGTIWISDRHGELVLGFGAHIATGEACIQAINRAGGVWAQWP